MKHPPAWGVPQNDHFVQCRPTVFRRSTAVIIAFSTKAIRSLCESQTKAERQLAELPQ
jgi:hypothetical protein